MSVKFFYVLSLYLLLATAVACGGSEGEQPVLVEDVEESSTTEPAVEEPDEAQIEEVTRTAEPETEDDGGALLAEIVPTVYTQDGNPCLRDVYMPCEACGGGGGEVVILFDVNEESSAIVSKLPLDGFVNQIDFVDPDGRFFSTSSWDEGILIRDANSGAEVANLMQSSSLFLPAVNSKKGLLAAADDEGKIWLWDLNSSDKEKGRLIVDLGVDEFDNSLVQDIALSPDGNLLAVTEIREARGENIFMVSRWSAARVFDIASGQELQRFEGEIVSEASEQEVERDGEPFTEFIPAVIQNGHAGPIDWLSFSPDSQALITANYEDYTIATKEIHGTESTIRIWDIATGEHLRCIETGALRDETDPTISPDGLEIATEAAGTVSIWDTRTSEVDRQFGLPAVLDMSIGALIYSSDGERLITHSDGEQAARIWDSATGRLRGLLRHPDEVRKVASSPDGRQILTISGDEVWLWNAGNPAVRRAAAAQGLVDDGLEAGQLGDLEGMLIAFEEAQNLAPEDGVLLRPQIWRAACKAGSLAGTTDDLLDFCDRAIAEAAAAGADDWTLATYHDGRGIAKALMGDYQGAIDDFQVFVDTWSGSDQATLRESWIETLSEGDNPIDEAALEALRNE